MSIPFALYLVALFVALTPGVLVKLPFKGKKLTVALTHAVLFAVVYQLTNTLVSQVLEGFYAVYTVELGYTCKRDSECKSKYCNANKQCENQAAEGMACTKDSGCITYNCKDNICSPKNFSSAVNTRDAASVAAASAAANATPGATKGATCKQGSDCKSNKCEKKNESLEYGRCA